MSLLISIDRFEGIRDDHGPHLLSLPAPIRQAIFDYLLKPRHVFYVLRIVDGRFVFEGLNKNTKPALRSVLVHNCPDPALLTVSRQFSCEYVYQATRKMKLDIVVNHHGPVENPDAWLPQALPPWLMVEIPEVSMTIEWNAGEPKEHYQEDLSTCLQRNVDNLCRHLTALRSIELYVDYWAAPIFLDMPGPVWDPPRAPDTDVSIKVTVADETFCRQPSGGLSVSILEFERRATAVVVVIAPRSEQHHQRP